MARQQGIAKENNFTRGLITENTALSFPANACTDTSNCVFEVTGRVSRRLGFDYESGASLTNLTKTTAEKFSSFLWQAAGGDGSVNILVQQQGDNILFFDASDNITPSANYLATYTLSTALAPGSAATPGSKPASFAQGDGRLFVAHEDCTPFNVEYAGGGSFTVNLMILLERDFLGAASANSLNTRPTETVASLATNDPNHLYNLVNQGWFTQALAEWDTERTDMPSNADTVAMYRNSETDPFIAARVDSYTSFESTPAPKGHFIIDVGNPQRTETLLTNGYTATVVFDIETTKRPNSIAFFAGRVWYAGIPDEGWSSKVYFSQIAQTEDQYKRCYQKQDPTSEFFADLLPDDGGVINIQDLGRVQKLFAIQDALMVFADNGVWIISGFGGQGFRANEYQVRKISSVGMNSPLSVVDAKGTPLWWGEDGIYTARFAPDNGNFTVESITLNTIKSFYLDIPSFNRQFVQGAYDARDEKVYWVYYDGEYSSTNDHHKYDKVLVLNMRSGAFYPWEINDATPDVRGVVYVQPGDRSSVPVVKYPTTANISSTNEYLTFSEFYQTSYLDWETPTGDSASYESYFITGYRLDGDGQRFSQPQYLFVYLDTASNSSAFAQGIFDFTNSSSSGKWSTAQQLYNSALTYRDVNFRRLKVRGKGRSMQLKMYSEAGKPFTIIGWTVWVTGNTEL
jgi:hypothetical protein